MTIHSLITKTRCSQVPTERQCSPVKVVLIGKFAVFPGSSRILKAHPHRVGADNNQGYCFFELKEVGFHDEGAPDVLTLHVLQVLNLLNLLKRRALVELISTCALVFYTKS